MKTHLAIAAVVLAACGDANTHDGRGLEVVELTPLEPLPALVEGPSYAFTGVSFTGSTVAMDDPARPWLVAIATRAQVGVATPSGGGPSIELFRHNDGASRLALMPIASDGTPGAPFVYGTTRSTSPRVAVTRCGEAVWVLRSDDASSITRIALERDDNGWSFGAVETAEVTADIAPFAVPLCLPTGRVLLDIVATSPRDITMAGELIGTIGNDATHSRHHIDLDALFMQRSLAAMWATDERTQVGRPGSGDNVLFTRTEEVRTDEYGSPVSSVSIHRWDFTTATETRLFAQSFERLAAVLALAPDSVIVCTAGELPFDPERAEPYTNAECLRADAGQVRWRTTLAPATLIERADLRAGVVWLSTTALVENARDGEDATVAALVGIDPDTGLTHERIAFASGGGSRLATPPRAMIGEGRCAGMAGIGALVASYEDDLIRYDRVLGAGGTTCSEPVAYFPGTLHQDFYLFERFELLEPSAGACAEHPHLIVSMAPPSFDQRHSLRTARAADCSIGIAP